MAAGDIRAGRAAVEIVADDQTAKGLSSTESRVNRTLAKLGTNFVRVGSSGSGGDLTKTVATMRSGFAGLAAAAGPAGIATAAAFGGAVLAVNQLAETIQRGSEAIRSLSEEAKKAGVSIETLTGGRVTGADVERINLMDSAAKELKRSIDFAAASLASQFAPAITQSTVALSVAVSVGASYVSFLSDVASRLWVVQAALTAVSIAANAVGAGNTQEDLEEIAKAAQAVAEGNAAAAKNKAAADATNQYRKDIDAQLKLQRELIGLSETEKSIRMALAEADKRGIKDAETLLKIRREMQETADRQRVQGNAEKAASILAEKAKEELRLAREKTAEVQKQIAALQLEASLVGKTDAQKAGVKTFEDARSAGLSEKEASALAARVEAAQKELDLKEALVKAEKDAANDLAASQKKAADDAARVAKSIREELKTPQQKIEDLRKTLRGLVDSKDLSIEEASKAFAVKSAAIAKEILGSLESKGDFASSAGALLALQAGGASKQNPLVDIGKKQVNLLGKVVENTAGGNTFLA